MSKNQAVGLILMTVMIALAGCATAYQKKKGSGFGYSDVRLSQKTYTIRFYGNKDTEEEWAQENCYRRAAELAVEQGYKYVVVLDANTKSHSTTLPKDNIL